MLDSVYHLGRLHFPHLLALGGIEDPRWKWATDKVAELQAENERLLCSLAASRALVEAKNRGLLWYSMPTHEGCLGAECPCMPGRALTLTEAEMLKRKEE